MDTAQLELEHPEGVGFDKCSPGPRWNPIVVQLWRRDTLLAQSALMIMSAGDDLHNKDVPDKIESHVIDNNLFPRNHPGAG